MAEAKSTPPIRALFMAALDSLPRPLTDDVIDHVFCAIERSPNLLDQYRQLCDQFGKLVVNTRGPRLVGAAVERVGQSRVPAMSRLIHDYSKLDQPAPPRIDRSGAEEMARKDVFDFYVLHKGRMPENAPAMREEIVQRVLDGLPVSQAFSDVLGKAFE